MMSDKTQKDINYTRNLDGMINLMTYNEAFSSIKILAIHPISSRKFKFVYHQLLTRIGGRTNMQNELRKYQDMNFTYLIQTLHYFLLRDQPPYAESDSNMHTN